MGIGEKRRGVTGMKRIWTLIIIFVFSFSTVVSAPVFAVTEEDSKKAETVMKDTSWFDYKNPKTEYRIATEAQLMGLASLVNENQIDKWKPTRIETFEGVTFTLAKDIKLTQPWTPIGTGNASHFAGTFDGNGHTISNMKVKTSLGTSGFFGYLVGEVKDLTIEGKCDSEDSNCGGIAGHLAASGRVTSCIAHIDVSGKDKTGGIVGFNEGGRIEGCLNTGKVSGTYKVGGVVGENWGGVVTSCGNTGRVISSKRGVATYGTGGVAGRSVSPAAEVSECYNAGTVVSNTEGTGGIVGYTNAIGCTVKDCYNVANITIDHKNTETAISKAYGGGIVGIAGVSGIVIRNCYNMGMIRHADVSGGIIGHYMNESKISEPGQIKNNYYISSGFRSGIGKADDPDDVYLKDMAVSVAESSMNSLSSSLSVAYMKDTGIYGNNGYPVLRWQSPAANNKKVYMTGVPQEIQNNLDQYLIKTAGVVPYGHKLLDFFSPDNVTTNAFIFYMEAQDKLNEKEQEKDAESNE